MPQNNRQDRRSESGNIFAIVMIGVVLFGALMYTFSRSAKQGDGNLTRSIAYPTGMSFHDQSGNSK